jgi:NAD(P)-dependent dehydrogenase (short-subunit alcohol dehydrogenase family)
VSFDHSGRRVWVTGASRGLGHAIALGFADAGADVALTARSQGAVDEVADEVRRRGGRALSVPGSVADPDMAVRAVAEIEHAWGGLDVLVSCAGISPTFTRAELVEDDDWREVIDVNVTGTFLCARAAGRLMLRAGSGSIINVSSVHGRAAGERLAAYAASKGAVDALTRTLAVEWAERGVRVNALVPGYFETDLTEGLRSSDRWRSRLLDRTPLRRFGVPDELVGAALFLASDCAGYMTGAAITVDGGWTAA